jgi:hypothetical protein
MGIEAGARDVQGLAKEFNGLFGLQGHLLDQCEPSSSSGCVEQMAKAFFRISRWRWV